MVDSYHMTSTPKVTLLQNVIKIQLTQGGLDNFQKLLILNKHYI